MAFNKKQKSIIYNSIFVVVFTAATIIGMFNFKDYVNKQETFRAINQLGRICVDFREKNRQVPSTYYVENIKKQLEGNARVGKIVYRGRWITFGAKDDEILAYVKKEFRHSFFKTGYIVLRLNGTVEWMDVKQFEELLASQQSPDEKKFTAETP